MTRIATLLGVLLLLQGCEAMTPNRGASPCSDGGSSCAAASAPPGMRQVLKGYRIVGGRWVDKTNKESGAPDIGIKAEWKPITERR